MVARYAHLADESLHEAVRQLDGALDGRDGHAVITPENPEKRTTSIIESASA